MIMMTEDGQLLIRGDMGEIVGESHTIMLTVISALNDKDKEIALLFIKETGQLLMEITKGIDLGYKGNELIERSINNV